jgi:hypothetical protein
VDIPYDLTRLLLFVSCTLFACVLSQPNRRHHHEQQPSPPPFLRYLARIGSDAFVVTLIMMVCGASPTRDVGQTVCAAVYLVAVATATATTNLPPRRVTTAAPPKRGSGHDDEIEEEDDATSIFHLSVLQRLSYASSLSPPKFLGGTKSEPNRNHIRRDRDQRRLLALIPCLVAVGLNVPFSVLRLYDRGWQWQRWPVPIIVATTYGFALGNLMVTVLQLRGVRLSRDDD